MSGKKTGGWKQVLLGLAVTVLVDAAGILLAALLTTRGVMGEERAFPLLAAAALAAAFAGGLAAGSGKAGASGALLNALLFGLLLAALCFSNWEGITRRGVFLLAAILAGGGLSCAVCGKAGKRRGKRLVKSTKKLRLS